MNPPRIDIANKMAKQHILGNLAIILMQGISISAYASYSEQWLNPRQLHQEDSRTHHAKVQYTCGSHSARCTQARSTSPTPPTHTFASSKKSSLACRSFSTCS
jgi:hypothetical protein